VGGGALRELVDHQGKTPKLKESRKALSTPQGIEKKGERRQKEESRQERQRSSEGAVTIDGGRRAQVELSKTGGKVFRSVRAPRARKESSRPIEGRG